MADDIILTKPAYQYQNQELYYADEILVEPNKGVSIQEIIRKLNLSKSIIVSQKKFYALLKVFPSLDACDVANLIQKTGLVKYSYPNFIMPIERHQVIREL